MCSSAPEKCRINAYMVSKTDLMPFAMPKNSLFPFTESYICDMYIFFSTFTMSLLLTPGILRDFISGGSFSKASMNREISSKTLGGTLHISFPVSSAVNRATSFLCLRISPSCMLCPDAFLSDKSSHAFALNTIRCVFDNIDTSDITSLPLSSS